MSEIIHEYTILTSWGLYFAQYNKGMENILRQKRKQLGLTQEQAAKACGVSRRTYQTYEETNIVNTTSDTLIKKMEQLGNSKEYVYSVTTIKRICNSIFTKYSQVECAYLYGSYARNEANSKSDIDILVVCHGMGLKFFEMAADLEESLNKKVDIQTHDQIGENIDFLENILVDGIKIYRKKN